MLKEEKLKRFYYILFAFVFTILTVGASVSKHYSGGELYSVALYGEADSCCEDQDNCECCDDESEIIQFNADYVFSISSILDHNITSIDLFADYTLSVLSLDDEISHNRRIFYRTDIHPPRETSKFLSQIQTYLL